MKDITGLGHLGLTGSIEEWRPLAEILGLEATPQTSVWRRRSAYRRVLGADLVPQAEHLGSPNAWPHAGGRRAFA